MVSKPGISFSFKGSIFQWQFVNYFGGVDFLHSSFLGNCRRVGFQARPGAVLRCTQHGVRFRGPKDEKNKLRLMPGGGAERIHSLQLTPYHPCMVYFSTSSMKINLNVAEYIIHGCYGNSENL